MGVYGAAMALKSFLTCPHASIQPFTEVCLDCGFNIHSSLEEVRDHLFEAAGRRAKVQSDQALRNDIERLERLLGRE